MWDIGGGSGSIAIEWLLSHPTTEAVSIEPRADRAARIRANADREVTIIKADATRDGERIRAEGDAERNRIYAEAFSRDPDFFAFYRSMQAYEQGMKGSETRMLLSPDSEFFRYFSSPNGGPPQPIQKR